MKKYQNFNLKFFIFGGKIFSMNKRVFSYLFFRNDILYRRVSILVKLLYSTAL